MDLKAYYQSGRVILHLLNQSNGFMGIEPGQDGAFTDSKGHVWLTSATEVSRLNPKKLRWGTDRLNVRFSDVNGEILAFNEATAVLRSNENSLIVNFDAICFNRPNPVQFSWKLDSKTSEWSTWDERSYAVISGLRNGKTTISLRARVPGLPLAEQASSSLTVQVKMAVYRRTWFFPTLFGLFAFAAFLSLGFLLRTRIRLIDTNRNAKMFQVQAIQAQMNPHFIFNVLASLQSMILTLKMEEANDYLIKLAKLIRGYLDASGPTGVLAGKKPDGGEVPLAQEIELLSNYIHFQQLVFPNGFDVEWNIGPELDTAQQTIPPMLIQPFVENAIRHGLLLKKTRGTLRITIRSIDQGQLQVEVGDDGIGMEKAATMIKKSPYRYVSKGRNLTLTRIRLLNDLGYQIRINTESSDRGTCVTLIIAKK